MKILNKVQVKGVIGSPSSVEGALTLPTNTQIGATTINQGAAVTVNLPAVAGTLLTEQALNDTTLTGTPTAPTAVAGTSTTQIATTEFVGLSLANSTAVYTSSAPGTTTNYFRLATVPITSNSKNGVFAIKAYTASGTVTEITLTITTAYNPSSYSATDWSIYASVAHSSDVATTAENGRVLNTIQVSYDGTNAYLDIQKYKLTTITIESKPLTNSDWVFHTGDLVENPTIGSYNNDILDLYNGLVGNRIMAYSAYFANYHQTGVLGANTISNKTDKTGQWLYFGSISVGHSSTYAHGRSFNSKIRMQEMGFNGVTSASLDTFDLNIAVSVIPYANSTLFNTNVPDIHLEVIGKTSLTVNDIAAVVTSTSTLSKTIGFYIKSKGANTIYAFDSTSRYGRAASASSYSLSSSSSYIAFDYASTQTPLASLPTPAQGPIVYISTIRSIIENPAPLASPVFTGVVTASQLKFPTVQVPSSDANTLDDYEEGTFTPTSEGHVMAGEGTYTSQVGYYTKIGDMVHVHATPGWTAHTGDGFMRIIGLPFATLVGSRNLATVFAQNLTYTNALSGIAVGGGNYIEIFGMLSNAYATATSLDATVYEISVSIVYKTNT